MSTHDITAHPIRPYDQRRQPTIVATGSMSLEGIAHTDPPCWPGSRPFIALNLVTTVHTELMPGSGVCALIEQVHEPHAIELETAAGLIATLTVTAEQMGMLPALRSLVDQIVSGGRQFYRDNPNVPGGFGMPPHDPATCNCPPYEPPDTERTADSGEA